MWILIISLVFLGIFSWLATHYNWFGSNNDKNSATETPLQKDDGEVCCGMHEVCEKDTLINFDSKPEYYDDEELDNFSDKSAAEFTEKDIDIFESIFYTLKPEDVAGWLRSLQIRNIELPAHLWDEALLIVSERRQAT